MNILERSFFTGILIAFSSAAFAFSGGNGTASNPYQIATPAELDEVRNAPKSAYFRLVSDLDMQDYISNTYGEDGWLPLTSSGSKAFTGYFHGGQHKIRGLNINRPNVSGIGLFAMLGEGALVDSVGVVGIITGKDSVGGISGSIEQGSHIYACYFQGSITGGARVGGISGFCGNGTELSYSYVAGNITGVSEVGGICGYNYSGAFINDCYHVGDVSGTQNVGGVLGYNNNGGRMTATYHTGKVTGTTAVGGIVGYNYNSNVTGSIFDISNAGVTDAVGGNTYGWTDKVAGKTPAEMVNIDIINSYFDLDNFWAIDTSLSYPFFNWDENPPYPSINGQGTESNPFQIYTAAQLDSVRNHPDAEWILMNDLDLTDYLKDRSFEPAGTPESPFTGHFRGQGYRITGLYIQTATDNAGLFGYTSGAKIDSLGVEGTVISTADYAGGLVGNAQNGTSVSSSYFKGDITGNSKAGGIVGCITGGGRIENVFHLGRVDAYSEAGGIAGTTVSGNIVVRHAFQAGTVSAYFDLGGIVDIISPEASFSDCYYDLGYSPLKAYSDNSTGTAQNVEGKTTAEMVSKETFGNWDFNDIWDIDNGATYPWLRVFPQKEYPKSFTTDGSPQNPYKIYTASQLDSVRGDFDGNYILMNDIDLSDYIAQYYPDSGWLPVGNTGTPFTGVFDGQGYKITGVTINRPADYNVGFFAINAGIIKNLGIEGTVIGGTSVGGFCGVLAENTNSITNSYFKGEVSGDMLVGGITGGNTGKLQDVYAIADVTATSSTAGGLVGGTGNGMSVTQAFFSGHVSSGDDVWGAIAGTAIDNAVIANVYFDSIFAGSSAVGNAESENISYTVLATCKATEKNSFDNLDFEDTWAIDDSLSYPYLRIFGNPYYPQIGTGSEEDPYQIYTPAQLDSVRYHLNAHYILMADLDLSKYDNWVPVGNALNPFTGAFNGNGHIIRQLNVLSMNTDYAGLFGSVDNATIEKLGVYGTVHGGIYVGGITGGAYNNTVLSEVFFEGSVIGTAYIGGVVGDMELATLKNAYHIGLVYGTASRIGGVAGHANNSLIEQTYHSGNLVGSTRIGGIIGCVLDDSDNETGTETINSYFNSQLSNVSCITGSPNTPDENRTDADFIQKTTFGGFDFNDVWSINEGKSYPFLQVLSYPYYPNIHYVSIDEDHGGRLPNVFAVTYGMPIGTRLKDALWGGYNFMGWHTERNCAGIEITPDSAYHYDFDTLNLYACWTPCEYKIIKVYQDGITQNDTLTVLHDAVIGSGLDMPYPRDGYTFMGWFDSVNGAGHKYLPSTVYRPVEDLVLYAFWTPDTFTVTFNCNYADCSVKTVKVFYGQAGILLELKRYGYIFEGWFLQSDKDTVEFDKEDSYLMLSDTVLYARWSKIKYNITFGDTTEKVAYLDLAVKPSDPVRTGYTFAGWLWDFSTPVTRDTVITPLWVIDTFTVSFYCEAGRLYNQQRVTYGSSPVVIPNPDSIHNIFAGWYLYADGTGGRVSDLSQFVISSDTTFYARWLAVPVYTVYFADTFGEYKTLYNAKVYQDSAAIKPSPDPQLTGNTFRFWYSGGDTVNKWDFSNPIECDTTLYAFYTPNKYTITLKCNNSEQKDVVYGNAINNLTDCDSTGYTFGGWFTMSDGKGQQLQSGEQYLFVSDTVLYAYFTPDTFNVYFADEGIYIDTQKIIYNNSVPVAPTPDARTGYTFTGWDMPLSTPITSDTTFTAVWAIDTFDVIFLSNDVLVDWQRITYGSTASLPNQPTLTGYHFKQWGWYGEFDTLTPITDDTLIIARWEIDTFTVKFMLDDTREYSVQQVVYHGKITMPNDPDSLHNIFDGWYASGSRIWDLSQFVLSGDTTLYAQWLAVPVYTVYFADTFGGYKTLYNAKVYQGSAAVQPSPDPQLTGNTFRFWYSGGDTVNKWDFSNPIECDTTLYAFYTPNKYTITLKCNNNSEQKDVIYGNAINNPTNCGSTGYTFGGWFTMSDGKGQQLQNGEQYLFVSDTVLYAYFTPDTFNVYFADEGIYIDTQKIIYNNSIAVAPTPDARTGYTFTGWDMPLSTPITSDTTFTAVWAIDTFDVIFLSNDVLISRQRITYGSTASLPPQPTLTGYHFKQWGWYGEFDPLTPITDDTLIIARWEIDTFTVKFMLDDTREHSVQQVVYHGKITMPNAPDSLNNTFDGWYASGSRIWDLSQFVLSSDTTLYAQWLAVPVYTVYFADTFGGYKTLYDAKVYQNSAAVQPSPDPQLTGNTFRFWYSDNDTVNKWDFSNPIECDTTLYAFYTPNKYTITLKCTNNSEQKDVIYGNAINNPTNCDSTGYTFGGWFTMSDGKGQQLQNGEQYLFVSDTVLYAYFTPDTFNVYFVNEELYIDTQRIIYNNSVAIAPTPNTRAGYTFTGWDMPLSTPITSDTTFTAVWAIDTFDVIFLSNDVLVDWQRITYGSKASLPEKPKLTGYHFKQWGWYDEFDPLTPITDDTLIIARWEIDTFTVKFMLDDTREYLVQPVVYHGKITMPADPDSLHNTFDGWYASGSRIWDLSQFVLSSDTTLYAQWLAVPVYTVYFADTFGGYKTLYNAKVYQGSAAVQPSPDPQLTGNTFRFWYSGGDTVNKWDFSNPIECDTTLYAFYTPNKYTITLKCNTNNSEQKDIIYGNAINNPTNCDSTGYTFGGWFTMSDGKGQQLQNGEQYLFVSDTVLYAYFTPDTFNVYFADKELHIDTQKIIYNNSVAIAPTPNTRTGYTFTGWDMPLSTPITSDTTFTAVWAIDTFDVIFLSNDVLISRQRITYKSTVNMPNQPTLTGYHFKQWGWYGEFDPSTPITDDTLIIARWEIDTFTVKFMFDDTREHSVQQVVYHGKITMPNAPDSLHNIFDGWYASGSRIWDLSQFILSSDTALYAQWLAVPVYTVYFADTFGGYKTLSSIPVYKEEAVSHLTCNPSLTGYTFAKWYSNGDTAYTWDFSTPITQDTVLYAYYTPNNYQVNFYCGGDNFKSITYNTPINVTDTCAAFDRYIFSGWYLDRNGQGKPYNYGDIYDIAGDTAFYAYLVPKTARFFLKYNDGITSDDTVDNVSVGAKLSDYLPVPSRTGYLFEGWWGASINGGSFLKDVYLYYYGDIELEAVWKKNTYSITLHNEFSADVDVIEVKYDSVIGQLPVPAHYGYIFNGWLLNGDMVTSDSIYHIAGNSNLYADWTVDTFTVFFYYNAEHLYLQQRIPYGSSPVAVSNPDSTGRIFAGWYLDTNFTLRVNDMGGLTVLNDTNLYAYFIVPPAYRILFMANGTAFDTVYSPSSVPAPIVKPITDPVLPEHIFVSWQTVDGTDWDFSKPVTQDTVLYASFLADTLRTYNVLFYHTQGNIFRSQEILYGNHPSAVPAPDSADRDFGGWYTSLDFTQRIWDLSQFTVVSDTALYALWIYPPSYKVQFVSFDKVIDEISVLSHPATAVARPFPDPVCRGYSFAEWQNSAGTAWNFSTVITQDTTIYAKWVIDTFSVTFHPQNGEPDTVQRVVFGGTAVSFTPSAPAGSVFNGWFNSDSAEFDFATPIVNDTSLYAYYTDTTTPPPPAPDTFSVTFHPQNGEQNTVQRIVSGGTAVSFTPSAPAGSVFNGWFNSDSAEFDFATPIVNDTSLYAYYTDTTTPPPPPPPPALDTVLLTLSVNGYSLSPEFSPYGTDYTVTLECPVTNRNITVFATARSGITVTYGGAASADGTLSVTAQDAGDHAVTITATAENGGSRTYTIIFRQPLPSTLLRRLWTDVIAVNLDSTANGGYIFTEFSWYKDGTVIPDQTGQYLYCADSLVDGAKYHALLTTAAGAILETCPYIYRIPAASGIKIYPNPVPQGGTVTVDISELPALSGNIEIYNLQGVLVYSFAPPHAGTFTLQAPYPAGVYIIKADKYSQKIIVIL